VNKGGIIMTRRDAAAQVQDVIQHDGSGLDVIDKKHRPGLARPQAHANPVLRRMDAVRSSWR
jgi:hypothetical protein